MLLDTRKEGGNMDTAFSFHSAHCQCELEYVVVWCEAL